MTRPPGIKCQFSNYKFVLISILFVLFFNGCSKPALKDKELYPYVEEFVNEGQKRGVKFQDDILEFDVFQFPVRIDTNCKSLYKGYLIPPNGTLPEIQYCFFVFEDYHILQ